MIVVVGGAVAAVTGGGCAGTVEVGGGSGAVVDVVVVGMLEGAVVSEELRLGRPALLGWPRQADHTSGVTATTIEAQMVRFMVTITHATDGVLLRPCHP